VDNAAMGQQPIELILARQLASRLAVPVMLVDEHGDTLYFNEPAEAILGLRFDELDTMSSEDRARFMSPRDAGGHRLTPRELPAAVALRERRPSHAIFEIAGIDGVRRPVEATGIPLEGAGGHMLGAPVIIWRTAAPPVEVHSDTFTDPQARPKAATAG
jgi:PAS domain S-box-containing protein